MQGMLHYTDSFNQYIGSWNVANVTDMGYMFTNANVFNQDISSWNVGNVTKMTYMFSGADAFNQPIGSWDVSNVTDMSVMFSGATAFNQDIGDWDVSSVTNMALMFYEADAFDQDLGSWNVSHVGEMSGMFRFITLSTENYDSLLNGWNSITLHEIVDFDGGYSTYCFAETARANIITTYHWTITDGGKSCNSIYLPLTLR